MFIRIKVNTYNNSDDYVIVNLDSIECIETLNSDAVRIKLKSGGSLRGEHSLEEMDYKLKKWNQLK